ncbi:MULTISPECIES: rhomboid family intramembrane serine protease [Roseobacter]|uniref:Rhomboid protease-like protein n=1 Tax=Roseobacter litoralis (strain ATCC 49566 / DSM 6996 / JCM 21268 / NBRC 15278 / OCh 149) TaxID=391595 RepID=F7ZL19_ROSLO|nr:MULTISPECIES: rhomboid family intramembrane serine protease [Roseobacter]AEI94030.1 rhomboid protease-like protein [Roseobacter litoralis Och 149]GIT85965.1 rhomboid family intramembrane serine protease [Roseobacter sp. OBYS 0001]
MFPIRDHNPSGRIPYVTYMLMAANIGIFLSYFGIMEDVRAMNAFWLQWAMIPARLSQGDGYYTLISSMFLHGGFFHLAGNMLFLWIFGDNIEDELGHGKFILFYLCCGVIASLAQYAVDPMAMIPTVGASGAIAGVMGGYLLLFPKAKVDILIILIVIFRILPIPSWIMLMLWLGMQVIGGIGSSSDEAGVAYWAHAGGFIAGLILLLPFWLRQGGPAFWQRTDGHPPHPEATYRIAPSRIPKVTRR